MNYGSFGKGLIVAFLLIIGGIALFSGAAMGIASLFSASPLVIALVSAVAALVVSFPFCAQQPKLSIMIALWAGLGGWLSTWVAAALAGGFLAIGAGVFAGIALTAVGTYATFRYTK